MATAAGAMIALTACGGDGDPLAEDGATTGDDSGAEAGGNDGSGGDGGGGQDPGSVTVGSANFPGNVLLAQIYAAALEDEGVTVDRQLRIGSRETYLPALEDGSIDLIPEYTGNLTLYFDPETEATESEEVYAALQEALPDDLTVLEPSDAEDKDAVVVTGETAEELDLTTIGDLEPHAGELVLGGPPEWQERFTGVPGLREVYGLEFESFRPLSAGGNLSVQSLRNGQVDAVNIFTTNPAITENDFVVLEDPENLFAAQNVVPLISKDAVNDTVTETLNEVSAELDTEILIGLMGQVITDGQDPADVAEQWVADELAG